MDKAILKRKGRTLFIVHFYKKNMVVKRPNTAPFVKSPFSRPVNYTITADFLERLERRRQVEKEFKSAIYSDNELYDEFNQLESKIMEWSKGNIPAYMLAFMCFRAGIARGKREERMRRKKQ